MTCNETAAEIIKIAENSYRDLNIGFANSLSLICEKETKMLMKLLSYKPSPKSKHSTTGDRSWWTLAR